MSSARLTTWVKPTKTNSVVVLKRNLQWMRIVHLFASLFKCYNRNGESTPSPRLVSTQLSPSFHHFSSVSKGSEPRLLLLYL